MKTKTTHKNERLFASFRTTTLGLATLGLMTLNSLSAYADIDGGGENPPRDPQPPSVVFSAGGALDVGLQDASTRLIAIVNFSGKREYADDNDSMVEVFAISAQAGIDTKGELSSMKLSLTPIRFAALNFGGFALGNENPSAPYFNVDAFAGEIRAGRVAYEQDIDLGNRGLARLQIVELSGNMGGLFKFGIGINQILDSNFDPDTFQGAQMQGLTGNAFAGAALPLRISQEILLEPSILWNVLSMSDNSRNLQQSDFVAKLILKTQNANFSVGFESATFQYMDIEKTRKSIRFETQVRF